MAGGTPALPASRVLGTRASRPHGGGNALFGNAASRHARKKPTPLSVHGGGWEGGMLKNQRKDTYQSRGHSLQKQARLKTPSLRFPLRAGGTEPVRGSPREAGGTCRRGAIVNSDRAIGITIECSASSRASARSSILVSNKIESIFIDCLTPNSVQRHRNSTNCPQPSLQPAFLFFRRQRFVVLQLYEHLHLSTFGYFERLFQPQRLICVAGAHGLYFHHLTHRVVYPIQARRGEVSLTYCC
jgi:hypothetical protein